MDKAMEAAARKVAQMFGGDVHMSDNHHLLNTEDWPIIALDAVAEIAVRAYLSALKQDPEVVQRVAQEIWDALSASGLAYEAEERRAKLSARAALSALEVE